MVADEKGRWERFIYRLTIKKQNKRGRFLLSCFCETELECWRTSLFDDSEEDVIELYEDHGTSEQFHSEYKSDLDMERLPSHSFALNDLMMTLGFLTFNCLRLIGQVSLELGGVRPTDRESHEVSRRRLRTVIHDFIHMGARMVSHSRRFKLVLSQWAWQTDLWIRLYNYFTSPPPIRLCA